MAKITDRIPAERRDSAENDLTAYAVLAAVADHLTDVDPTEALKPNTLQLCVSVEAYELTGRTISGAAPVMARAALAAVPEMPIGITRGECALHLRKAVTAAGCEWTEDDNKPVIPTIPGQRREPTRPVPEQSDAPVCCGRPMRRDGQQYVCRKCRSYVDQGGEA